MDLETLKKDCNDLIDELENLQASGTLLDNRILELQEQLRVLREQAEPERIKLGETEPELTETILAEPEQTASKQTKPAAALPEPEEQKVKEQTEAETAARTEEKEAVEEEYLWKDMDKQRFSKGTVIIYEQNPVEKIIVAIIKLLALCAILGGIMFCMIYLFANMK